MQRVLKAPKNQYNSFGKYKYRSCEDILEAVKPLCIEQGAVLTLCDDIVLIGERFYVRASATFTDIENGDSIHNCAFAREDESKKGMDGCQVTGSASSYARKYCLNGLFCIDDTKDSDTDENHNESVARSEAKVYVKREKGKTYVLASTGDYYAIDTLSLEQLNKLTNDKRFAEAHKEVRELMAKHK